MISNRSAAVSRSTLKVASILSCSYHGFPTNPSTKINISLNDDTPQQNNKEDSIKTVNKRMVKSFVQSTIYDPFDFSMAKLHMDQKNKTTYKPMKNMNPLNLYTSPELLVPYMSSTGKILHRDVTGLSVKDQRRVAKAIRRAQAIGLLSKTHNQVTR
ncbi:hypothetical protein KAFR_0L00770 [Kazachstania africana CBS 2517]|uniref:Small ribosomal subunit protein bS18m n=1 Tax=Kazachstania africana (strain ATCC 22294 / BCRC 22015 / CBS 2517 / CECT 1963 / NBRC 1671 / NRRL Y-8276) TaxID=1071382 RepID=H2B234_KAZAF|nr:hypothetical protein KAFR_0L00770 [Kazachstania africana CBS 2517]CCF60684.1 hypothetical protein KAFR_0L00770 [Kazachstania africana CBS 2517]